MGVPVIVNVVATASLDQKVDLLQVAEIENTIYGNEIYGGRVACLKKPNISGESHHFY